MSQPRVAIIVLNFRMAAMTDALVARIRQVTRHPHDLFVIDNGSPHEEIAKSTTHVFLSPTKQYITGGFNFGIRKALERERDPEVPEAERPRYAAFWFVCNDIRIRKNVDVLAACMRHVEAEAAAGRPVGLVHPSMERDPATFNHPAMLHDPSSPGIHEVDWADIIAPIYTRAAMEAIGWEFNPELPLGWGIDRESCHLCWENDLRVVICDDAQIWHNMGTTYQTGKVAEFKDFDAYKQAAGGAQWPPLKARYGDYEALFAGSRRRYHERRKAQRA